jgi:hypothetical protein
MSNLSLRRFSLRAILILVALSAVVCTFVGLRIQRQRAIEAAKRRITEMGATPTWNRQGEWTSIDFHQTDVDDTSLALVQPLQHVQAVWLYDTKVTGKGLAHLRTLPKLSTLSVPASVTDSDLAILSKFSALQNLGLTGEGITAAAIPHLLRIADLRSIQLKRTAVTDEGLNELLQGMPDIKGLDLWGTKIDGRGFEDAPRLASLWSLELAETEIDDAGLKRMEKMPALAMINLSRTKVTDAGLACLSRFPELAGVQLAHCNIGDAGAEYLSRLPRLNVLSLAHCAVGDNGAEYLSRLSDLICLNLSHTRIGDDGVAHLSQAQLLSRIDLSYTKVTDKSVEALANLESSQIVVWLHHTNVTEAGIAELLRRRPDFIIGDETE